jgi:transporter family protein
MFVVIWLERKGGKQSSSFQWRWTIPFISLFICAADLAYFYSLSLDDSMISVVSMVRRGSVIISFLMGAFFFHERNLKSKAVDLVLVLLGLLLLYLGTAGY